MFCFIYGSFSISGYRFSNGEGTLCNNDILFVLISCLERQYPIIPVSFFISTTWPKIIFFAAESDCLGFCVLRGLGGI